MGMGVSRRRSSVACLIESGSSPARRAASAVRSRRPRSRPATGRRHRARYAITRRPRRPSTATRSFRSSSTSPTTTRRSPRSSTPTSTSADSTSSSTTPATASSGAIEELTEEQARQQIEVNLFGALWVTQAALPILREQGSGWIVQVSSIGGLAAFPLTGIYHASKWALEGFSETLRQEVEPFGIKVLMVEPSGFRTDWAGIVDGPRRPDRRLPGDRRRSPSGATAQQEDNNGSQPGNPDLAAQALLDTLDRDDPPFRLLLGNVAYDVAVDRYESRLKEFRAGEQVARGADDQ